MDLTMNLTPEYVRDNWKKLCDRASIQALRSLSRYTGGYDVDAARSRANAAFYIAMYGETPEDRDYPRMFFDAFTARRGTTFDSYRACFQQMCDALIQVAEANSEIDWDYLCDNLDFDMQFDEALGDIR